MEEVGGRYGLLHFGSPGRLMGENLKKGNHGILMLESYIGLLSLYRM